MIKVEYDDEEDECNNIKGVYDEHNDHECNGTGEALTSQEDIDHR